MKGENFVTLVGKISRPTIKQVGQYNTSLFKGSIAIPTDRGTFQYLKVAAWADIAETLYEVGEVAMIKVHGHIEESSYDGKCRHCGGSEKKYWTEVVIDNFVIMTDDEVQ